MKKVAKILKVIMKASPEMLKGILIGQIFNMVVLYIFVEVFVVAIVTVHK
jgi:hypothetical protein